MLVTLSGIVMLVRLRQLMKATDPMLVTLSGIVMLVRLLQYLKALGLMLVTVFPSIVAGIANAPDTFLSQLVIVIESPLISYFKLVTALSPHPPRSRGSVTMIRNKGTRFRVRGSWVIYFAQATPLTK